MTRAQQPSIQFESLVFGETTVLDDPAEDYHEASRLYPATARARLPGLALLETDPVARASVDRASRRNPSRDGVALPPTQLPRASLGDAIGRRSSAIPAAGPLGMQTAATLLGVAYEVRETTRGWRRPIPSAGALYPLELYAICRRVRDVPRGLYHYDPFAHRLELLRSGYDEGQLADAFPDPEPLATAALVLVLTAVSWRSRFKYGQRGYRFGLLEAGHLAQNVLLACAALGISALPVGGFYDRRLDAIIGIDGVHEASLYVVVLGGER